MTQLKDRLEADRLAIFLFHGVVQASDYPVRNATKKHLTLARFEEHLDSLLEVGSPISLDHFLKAQEVGRPLPKFPFAITFDDGFFNNLDVAAPALIERGIPATFYLTTGFLQSNQMSWTDRLEYALEETTLEEAELPKLGPWDLKGAQGRREAMAAYRKILKADPEVDLLRFPELVFEALEVQSVQSSLDPLDRKLSFEEAKKLHNLPGMQVGGHSHTHGILAFLSDDELKAEIDTSLELLEEALGEKVRHYSYPEGLAHCYDSRVIELLKGHQIVASPTALDGLNALDADPFELRRIMVLD